MINKKVLVSGWPVSREEDDIKEANIQLVKLRAMKELIKNNELACVVEVADLSIGFCNNMNLLSALNDEIDEVGKFLKGLPSKWD
jgi:hypothetical protein